MNARPLTFGQRTFLGVIQKLSEMSEGYSVGFVEELIRQHGIGGFFKWAKATSGLWNELVKRYGEKDAHAVAAFASLWNGCDYCAYGHVLAYNLEEFEQSGALFPLDEAEIPALLRMRDGEILETARNSFQSGGKQALWRLLERQHALKNGAPPSDDEDRALLKAAALYEWVNECSIVVDGPAPPLGRIAKKKELRTRYEEARRADRAAKGAAKPAAQLASA